jgi:hypothetical protein
MNYNMVSCYFAVTLIEAKDQFQIGKYLYMSMSKRLPIFSSLFYFLFNFFIKITLYIYSISLQQTIYLIWLVRWLPKFG